MVDLNMERLQAASVAKFGLAAQGGLQRATGIKKDINGIAQQLYGLDANAGLANPTDDLIELISDSTWLGGQDVSGRYDWTPANLTRRLMTDVGGATHVPTVLPDGRISFQATGGTAAAHSSSLREFYTINGLTGENWEAFTIIDAPNYGLNIGSGPIGQQLGMCFRYQESGGNHTAITINNGAIFGTAHINYGAWSATTAGASFANRQAGFPNFSNPPFPYGIKVRLVGLQCQIWQFPFGGSVPPNSDTTNYRSINLDTEAGNIVTVPTPLGVGGAGLIVAHGGTDTRSAMIFNNTWFRVLD